MMLCRALATKVVCPAECFQARTAELHILVQPFSSRSTSVDLRVSVYKGRAEAMRSQKHILFAR